MKLRTGVVEVAGGCGHLLARRGRSGQRKNAGADNRADAQCR